MFSLKILQELNLKPHQIQKLDLYIQKLRHFNQKFSLISRRRVAGDKVDATPDQAPPLSAEISALMDSVVAGQLLLKKARPGPMADIGSGAGFPGLVLALLDLDREFWLYEVNRKKTGFLEYMACQMNLKNIKIKNMPIQEEKPKSLNQGVSKAFFSLSKRLDLTKAVFKEGACYYHLQSLSYKKEWDKRPAHIKHCWDLISAEKYSHRPHLSERVLLRTDRK